MDFMEVSLPDASKAHCSPTMKWELGREVRRCLFLSDVTAPSQSQDGPTLGYGSGNSHRESNQVL